ncbi:putative glycosyltransferase, type 1 [Natrialba magadii ATCC 43099]|uniref:Glycosyltransferase, type 1 n=1 Tax=Natrialba magadii (strain ATCC 43099 / DSM 3394 / CCM 3739 / CIP 104546 / IAM 13178 / JCM 8861 / NBRC 102185 / NCIMB 2190 / MS3) TaxID=547559 RepID=D3SR13_NATMM|nr:glycosyltransferase [Natrialba magadii]ADD06569.1 putative glycosyltransferase, type 1 [Natrialba magadii ATCC 43099]ELY31970.1 group 1 glycosyl transferase [Natrialba magadii ATCC 43099]
MHVLTLTTNADAPFMTEQMRALERRGVTFSTLSVAGDVDGGTSRSPLEYLKFFPSVLKESGNGYDLIHAHYGLTGPMAVAQWRKPVVLSLWGSDVYGPVEPVSRACAPLCDELVVMSEEMRTYLGRDCAVIPDGIDLEKFQPAPQAEAQEAVGWDSDAHHVLFPYTPEREVKNYPRARRVVNAVNGLFDDPVHLHTVYDVPHDTVPDYMNAADALLLTSHSEGSPNSVKEALACNLPIVAVDVGDVRERLDGVSNSLVADSDEALIGGLREVLESGERSDGRNAAREISVEQTADRLLEVYERVA